MSWSDPSQLNSQYFGEVVFEWQQSWGSIPFQFCNLSLLATLDLSNNFISGEIPSYFGELTNLLNLDLSHNNLTDTIPFSLFYKTNKTNINLSYNSLNDAISVVLVKALPLNSLMGNKDLHIAITDCPLCISPHPWTTKKERKSSCNPKQFRIRS